MTNSASSIFFSQLEIHFFVDSVMKQKKNRERTLSVEITRELSIEKSNIEVYIVHVC